MTSTPTRRQFLGAAAGVLAVGVAAALSEGLAGAVPAARIPSGGTPFAQPQELVSANGRLDVELVAAPSNIPFGTGTRFAYTYNGTTPGPTLRVRPGDVLSITLVNRLGETTNLHTHGLHVSPSGHADNVFVAVANGARRTYTYEIPHDHRSGTFWYHPHMHEMVAPQVFGGLAGMIIVEDDARQAPRARRCHRAGPGRERPGDRSLGERPPRIDDDQDARPRGRRRRRQRRRRTRHRRASGHP